MSSELKIWMQILGGVFYLENKIFFSFKERSEGEVRRVFSILAWAVYIIGLPFWLVILAYENDWMVAFVEAGGAPAMLLGLILAWRREDENPSQREKRLELLFDYLARAAAVLGIGVSLYHVGFMTNLSQWAELGVTVGFLVGTYRLAKNKLDGYAWFFLMNASAGWLMYMQHYTPLAFQQAASLVFVVDAYRMKRKKERGKKLAPART